MNSGIAPLQNLAILRQVKQVEITGTSNMIDGKGFAKNNITVGLNALEKSAAQYAVDGGRYLGGSSTPTVADIYLIPQLYNAKRFEVDLSPYPTLSAIQANCEQLTYFVAARPEKQPDFK